MWAMVGLLTLLLVSVVPAFAQDPIGGAVQTLTAATAYARQTDSTYQQQQRSASQTDTALRQGAESARQTSSAADSQARSAAASATAISASSTAQYLGLQRDGATATASAENAHATETRRADFAIATAKANTSATAQSVQMTVTSDSATRSAERTATADAANAQATAAMLASEERNRGVLSVTIAVGVLLLFGLAGWSVIKYNRPRLVVGEAISEPIAEAEFSESSPTQKDEDEIQRLVLESIKNDPPPPVIFSEELDAEIERMVSREPNGTI